MDVTHFGLRRRPFRATPDTDAYYPAGTHEAALNRLRRALEADDPICMVTGEPGTGKSLVVRRLLETTDEPVRTVLLTQGRSTHRLDLLQAILFDLGLPYRDLTEQTARLAVTDSCLEHFRQGGKTLIVVDEADGLSTECLEELRTLANLEGKDGRAVQVLLSGLPELDRRIDVSGLVLFKQRLSVRCKLEPLSADEAVDFLLHQVRACGGNPQRFFGDDVLDILCDAGRGIPRLLNQSAATALQLADEAGGHFLDAEAAVEAVTRLGLGPEANDERATAVSATSANTHSVEPLRIKPAPVATAVSAELPPMAEPVAPPPIRPTIPFTPVILPMEQQGGGPPTFVYGHDPSDGRELIGPRRPNGSQEGWFGSADQVG